MEDDLIASLTRQVKEEVIENYLTQRRLIELQMEDIHGDADNIRFRALKTGRRLNRMAFLVIRPEIVQKLVTLLNIPQHSFWNDCLESRFTKGVRLIRVRAWTDKGKFKKLFLEAYHRLYQWMKKYEESYEDLKGECQGINDNIRDFQRNFDILTITQFLKSLDTATLERKLYLGENFTAAEMASVEQKLYLHPVSFEKLNVPEPLPLPEPESIENALNELAEEVYRKYQAHIKRIIQ